MALSKRQYRQLKGAKAYARGIRIDGINEVTKNLNKYLKKYKLGSRVSMTRIMVMLRRAMDEESPKIPVDLGNLRSSWFTKFVQTGKDQYGVIFGFSANYALYVHEMVGADFVTPRWRYEPRKRWYIPRPGAGPKFMETHMKRKRNTMQRILLEEMRKRTKEGVGASATGRSWKFQGM